jgi:PAS domain S-box-containing protein
LLTEKGKVTTEDYLTAYRELFKEQNPVRCVALQDENGVVLKVLGLVEGAGQPTSATGLIDESDFRFQEMLDSIPQALLVTDAIGVISNANQGAVKSFGFSSRGQLLDRSIYEFIAPAHRHPFQQDWQKTLREGKIEQREHTFLKADGTEYLGSMFTSVLKDSAGNITGIVLGIRNITAWKQLQDSLSFSELVLKSIRECVIAWDREYTIVHWNPTSENVFGITAKDAIGKKLYEVFDSIEHYNQKGQYGQTQSEALNHFKGEAFLRTRKASVWVDMEVFATDRDGERQGWVAVAMDITERKQMAQHISILDQAVASSLTPIFLADPDGNLTYANDAFLKLWNFSKPQDIRGKPMAGLWQSADMAEGVMRALKDTGSWSGEITARRNDGSVLDTQLSAVTVKDAYGRAICIMVSLIDVTETNKARVAIEESQAFVSGLLDNSHHPMLVINPDTSIRYINPAMEKLTGFVAGDLVGTKAPYPWAVQESMPRTVREYRVAMSHGPKWYEELYRKKNGKYFWVEVASAPVMKEGKLIYYMVSWVDITERRLIEEELTKERDRQKTYLDTVGVMVATIDSHGKITMVNKKGCETLGYTEKELIAQNWYTFLVPPRIRSEVRKNFRALFSQQYSANGAKHSEGVLVTRGGEEKLFSFTHTLIRVPGRKAAQILISGEDSTELRKNQEQLEHSHLLASLGEMTAGIAHEVNNPLGSILLYSELLLASDVPPQTKKDLKVIHDEAKRATKIMTDLLIYGRRTKPQVRRVNLNTIVRKVLEMRGYQHKVQNIQVTTQLTENPLYVKGDSPQLMQVFMNIILNAEDALREHKGGLIIVTTQAGSRWAKLTVADDGPGIPEAYINQIFYPFFTTKPVGEGTGLGLSICYGIVTAHNGLIRAENNSMGGATFIVELPLSSRKSSGSAAGKNSGNGKSGTASDKKKNL